MASVQAPGTEAVHPTGRKGKASPLRALCGNEAYSGADARGVSAAFVGQLKASGTISISNIKSEYAEARLAVGKVARLREASAFQCSRFGRARLWLWAAL